MVITPFHRWAKWSLARSHGWHWQSQGVHPSIGLQNPSRNCQAALRLSGL